jgi:hypothetical protein
MDGSCYDLSTGLLTGGAQPLSQTMLELRQLFWPRWQDCSLVFTTWATGEPAAVARFEICEPAEGIFRINSVYPPDGFWWDSQLRITPAFAAGVHFMEPYAHALAELDACRLTRGGLFLDKAHTEELRRFARAYCALPRQRFATVGSRTDPVALRQLLGEGRQYCYLVNREYYPVQVDVEFNRRAAEVCDLAEDQVFRAPGRWGLELGPYALRAFSFPSRSWVRRCRQLLGSRP